MLLNPFTIVHITVLGLGTEISVTRDKKKFTLDITFSYIWDAGTITFEWNL